MAVEHSTTPEPSAAGGKGFRLSAGAVATVIGVAALVVFMLQNTKKVRVTFLAWHFTWALWLLSLVSALLGALAWTGASMVRRHRRRKERRQARD